MPKWIESPTLIPVPGNKIIEEFVGAINTQSTDISISYDVAGPPVASALCRTVSGLLLHGVLMRRIDLSPASQDGRSVLDHGTVRAHAVV